MRKGVTTCVTLITAEANNKFNIMTLNVSINIIKNS